MITHAEAGTRNWTERPGREIVSDSQWESIVESMALSARENQVCRLLFEGYTRDEIADRLKIKTRTVRHYMEQLHKRLKVSNRVGLVLRIVQVRDSLKIEQSSEEVQAQQQTE